MAAESGATAVPVPSGLSSALDIANDVNLCLIPLSVGEVVGLATGLLATPSETSVTVACVRRDTVGDHDVLRRAR